MTKRNSISMAEWPSRLTPLYALVFLAGCSSCSDTQAQSANQMRNTVSVPKKQIVEKQVLNSNGWLVGEPQYDIREDMIGVLWNETVKGSKLKNSSVLYLAIIDKTGQYSLKPTKISDVATDIEATIKWSDDKLVVIWTDDSMAAAEYCHTKPQDHCGRTNARSFYSKKLYGIAFDSNGKIVHPQTEISQNSQIYSIEDFLWSGKRVHLLWTDLKDDSLFEEEQKYSTHGFSGCPKLRGLHYASFDHKNWELNGETKLTPDDFVLCLGPAQLAHIEDFIVSVWAGNLLGVSGCGNNAERTICNPCSNSSCPVELFYSKLSLDAKLLVNSRQMTNILDQDAVNVWLLVRNNTSLHVRWVEESVGGDTVDRTFTIHPKIGTSDVGYADKKRPSVYSLFTRKRNRELLDERWHRIGDIQIRIRVENNVKREENMDKLSPPENRTLDFEPIIIEENSLVIETKAIQNLKKITLQTSQHHFVQGNR